MLTIKAKQMQAFEESILRRTDQEILQLAYENYPLNTYLLGASEHQLSFLEFVRNTTETNIIVDNHCYGTFMLLAISLGYTFYEDLVLRTTIERDYENSFDLRTSLKYDSLLQNLNGEIMGARQTTMIQALHRVVDECLLLRSQIEPTSIQLIWPERNRYFTAAQPSIMSWLAARITNIGQYPAHIQSAFQIAYALFGPSAFLKYKGSNGELQSIFVEFPNFDIYGNWNVQLHLWIQRSLKKLL